MFGRTHIVSTWKTGFSFIYKLWDSSDLDGLLNPGELGVYDRRLSEKWSERLSYLEAQEALEAEGNKNKFALELYQHCQENGVIPIRRDFIEAYLSKGSYHLLADRLDIGWHPEFGTLLVASNEGAA